MGLLRFYLALSVVAAHSDPTHWLPFVTGQWAVRVFFIISGFYMSLALTKKYSDIGVFWLNRALRLYPTYLLFVVLYWAWYFFTWWWLQKPPYGPWLSDYTAMHWWQAAALAFSNWTMIGQDLPSLFDFSVTDGFIFPPQAGGHWVADLRTIGPAWSLGLEIWFYLLVPFMVRLRTPLLLTIAFASGALALMAPEVISYFSFPTNLVFFVIGMLLQRHSNLANNFFAASNRFAIDRAIGNLSYPIYVSHMVLLGILANITHSRSFWLALPATLIVSAAVYRRIERPIDEWRASITRPAS